MVTTQAAKSEAAAKFRTKLEAQIEAGRASALALFEKVQREVPEDRIANTHGFRFDLQGEQTLVLQTGDNPQQTVHHHALHQILERVGIPRAYATSLSERGPWGAELLVQNLNRLYEGDAAKRALVRAIGSQVRAVLSDKFRRLDSRPLLDAFAEGCQEIGAVPIEGTGGDTRVAIKALIPQVFEPVPGEVLAFGLQWSNSDFGNGANSVRGFILRLACLNGMTMEEALREIHLGRKLSDDVAFSSETYRLDTATTVSAMRDVIRGSLAPAKIDQQMEIIRRAAGAEVDPRAAFATMQRNYGLLKAEVEAVRETYNNGGVEQLPPGNSMYRMSNAISWIAKSAETPERRLELEQVAGEVLLKAAA